MPLRNLDVMLKFFQGSQLSAEERTKLYGETLFMTLARATGTDTKIHIAETQRVQDIMRRETGNTVASADIHCEAINHVFETASFDKLLERAREGLSPGERAKILQALAEVIRADNQVAPQEVTFFNMVATCLDLTPAEISGL